MQTELTALFGVYTLFFFTGHLFIKKSQKQLFLLSAALLISLFLLFLLFLQYDAMLCRLPLWLQRHITLLIWLTLGALVGLVSVVYLHLKRIFLSILLNAVYLLSFWYYNEPVYSSISPIDPLPNVTNQTTLYSCACASLSTIAKHKGIRISEREACRLIGTTRYGSNPGQIRYAANELGFSFKTLPGSVDIAKVHPPALLFVDRRGGYENHAVAYLSKKDGKYILFDPMEGWRFLDRKQMQSIWHGRGIELF